MEHKSLRVLVVDDDNIDRETYRRYLSKDKGQMHYEISELNTGIEAIEYLNEKSVDCLILDYGLPGVSGLELLEQVRQDDRFSSVVVILLTGEGSEQLAVDAMKNGADDYLCKNDLSADRLRHSLEVAIENKRLKNSVKMKTRELDFLAKHDPLTNCMNRRGIFRELEQQILLAKRHNRFLAVMFIDIDHFKNINDSYGHAVGDKLLIEVVNRVKSCMRNTDHLGRAGGDEFIACLTDINDYNAPGRIAKKIIDVFKQVFIIDSTEIHISLSIGIVCYPDLKTNSDKLIKAADFAMYTAKSSGRNTYQYYSDELSQCHQHRMMLENNLKFAIERKEFFLVYQPQIDLYNQKMVGVEVLLRWQDGANNLIPPSEFIPIAEQTGMIDEICDWIIEEIFKVYSSWYGKYTSHLPKVAINVSGCQFNRASFIDKIMSCAQCYNLSPGFLDIELTESTLIQDIRLTNKVLDKLNSLGVSISIDDFGTGYSSFSKLAEFIPIEKLKIDKSFVHQIGINPKGEMIAKSIIDIAHNLDLSVTAEGIENEQQLAFLQIAECDFGQGYFFFKPLQESHFEKLIETRCR